MGLKEVVEFDCKVLGLGRRSLVKKALFALIPGKSPNSETAPRGLAALDPTQEPGVQAAQTLNWP